ncbi:hypothetical protein, partial [Symbiopectobacterium sp.]|uniref:hypothetical protein n=1 Tax=Symbiopectobacterium sp. TaxID=2952789 RepID=UPI003F683A47
MTIIESVKTVIEFLLAILSVLSLFKDPSIFYYLNDNKAAVAVSLLLYVAITTAYYRVKKRKPGKWSITSMCMMFIRHSAPTLRINSTVSLAENINDGLVNRIEVGYLWWSVTNTE